MGLHAQFSINSFEQNKWLKLLIKHEKIYDGKVC